jgi:hypothetical protein
VEAGERMLEGELGGESRFCGEGLEHEVCCGVEGGLLVAGLGGSVGGAGGSAAVSVASAQL